MKKFILLLLTVCLSLTLISCKSSLEETEIDSSKLQVSATFHAMKEFVLIVGQDKVEVSTIVPASMEPHDFEPKAADIMKLSKANVFVYNGLGMETWADKMIESAQNENLIIIDASTNCTPITSSHVHESEHESEHEMNEHGQYDPHLWLSIKGAELEIQNIANGLSEADPDNKEFYQTNATNYITKLEQLFTEYESKFSSLDNKNFVTGHAAFNYFCRDFGLIQKSVADVFADGEPSTKQLAKLVDFCKDNNVTTIFTEDMVSPEISRTLANEIGADVKVIHTMESAKDDLTFFERMQENCENIYLSLSK